MSDNGPSLRGGIGLAVPDLQLITSKELLELLNIGMSSLERIRASEASFPKPVRIGSKVIRWRLSEVRRWVEQGGTGATHNQA